MTGVQTCALPILADSNGGFYILQRNTAVVRYVSATGGIRSVVTGLSNPQGIASDTAGNLYISDQTSAGLGGNIRKVDLHGISTNIAVDRPGAIVTDATGSVYFVETFSKKIRKIDASGLVSLIVSSGLDDAQSLSFDSAGNLLVSDAGVTLTRIARVDAQGSVSTFGGSGVGNYYSSNGGSALNVQLSAPGVLGTDGAGNLYIIDAGRIMKIGPSGTNTVMADRKSVV